MNPVESKIVIIGESGVGKTSISIRYVEDTFTDGKPPTVGATYFIKEV